MATFRVMTYNILYGGVGRERRIREVIDAIQPDVAVLTEVTRMPSFLDIARAVGPHHLIADDPRDRWRTAIVSRWPLAEPAAYGPPWSPRKWLEATVHPHGGAPVTIHAVHLAPHPLWPFEILRRQEVVRLVQRLRTRSDARQIVAGDFNALMIGDRQRRDGAPPWVRAQWFLQGGSTPRWALKTLTDAGYTDCYRACHPEQPGFTIPAWNPAARIDYVFASPSLRAAVRAAGTGESHARHGRAFTATSGPAPARSLAQLLGWTPVTSMNGEASDHLPVWVEFEWSPRADNVDAAARGEKTVLR